MKNKEILWAIELEANWCDLTNSCRSNYILRTSAQCKIHSLRPSARSINTHTSHVMTTICSPAIYTHNETVLQLVIYFHTNLQRIHMKMYFVTFCHISNWIIIIIWIQTWDPHTHSTLLEESGELYSFISGRHLHCKAEAWKWKINFT